MTFSRSADEHLESWLRHPRRKPLILRGARQTGKTTSVRRLGEQVPLLIELNLERHQDLSGLSRANVGLHAISERRTGARTAVADYEDSPEEVFHNL